MHKFLSYKIIMVAALLFSCKKMPEKQLCNDTKDPNCEGYIIPHASFISAPTYGDIIDSNFVELSWSGNQELSLFSYKLSRDTVWSAWSHTKTIEYDCLKDGPYNFYVKESYPSGDVQTDATEVFFVVDYVKEPALLLEESCKEVSLNGEFEIFLSVEEINQLYGAFVSLSFDPQKIALTESKALASILCDDVSKLVFIASDAAKAQAEGLLEINLARFGGEAGNPDLERIVALKFRAITIGETQIIINRNSQIRDVNNESIEIKKRINASINII